MIVNKNQQILIKLTDVYERSISSRSSISILVKKYESSTNIDLLFDFDRIAFMSRSAAQQLTLEKNKLEKNNIKFVYCNIDFQINRMLELAEHKLERKIPNVYIKQFSSEVDTNNFLLEF